MQRIAAAVLAMPALAAASHDTAAEAWGMTSRGIRSIHVVTTRWDRVVREGVVVHESLDLIESDVTTHNGVPTTTPQRTVVDLGASNRWLVEGALDEGIRRGLMTLEDVEAVVARVGRRGRRGVGVIRPLIAQRQKWRGVTESALEDLFRKTLSGLGLPQPVPQYVVRDDGNAFVCRADFAYPRERLLIELDSEAHHMDRVSFYRDRSKQNRAITLGWRVLRFTWRDLKDDPHRVGAEIRSILGAPDD
jgi:hypothetical protein